MGTEIRITVLGDVCPTQDYQPFFDEGAKTVLADLIPAIRESDCAICNLECPVTDNFAAITKTGPNLRANSGTVRMLTDAGIRAVSLANNHILDHGEQGIFDTLHEAEKCGMMVFGGGKNAQDAAKPLIIEIKGKQVAFLSFAEHEFNLATAQTAGANHFDPYVSLRQISETKKKVDYLIVLYHGGIEHYKYPSPLLQKKCRAMVDAGADAVFCQHSHCIGTMETYLDRPIVYGQGNTVFGYRSDSPAWNEGLLFTLLLNGNGICVQAQVLSATAKGIRCAEKAVADKRLQEWQSDSAVLQNPDAIKKKWDAFCAGREALVMPSVYGKSRVLNKLNRLTHNKLMKLMMSKHKYRVTMAYIRCEAHHEVVQTILENRSNEK